MIKSVRRTIAALAAAAAMFAPSAFAVPLEFVFDLPGGFDVSINGGALAPSGPIHVVLTVDDATPDTDPDGFYGEFAATSVVFTGAGFVNETVLTPLALLTWNNGNNFAVQRVGEFNQGIIGWNGATSSGAFMTDSNDLSTLVPLPYTTTGTSTFWFDGLGSNLWTLSSGDTIGGNIGGNGPDGTFSIRTAGVPEPSSAALLGLGIAGLIARARRKRPTAA